MKPVCFRHPGVCIINPSGLGIENHVLKNGSVSDRMEDIRLFFLTEINAFGITSPLNVKDSVISPAVFIIPNQASVRVCRKGRLPCSGKSKIPKYPHSFQHLLNYAWIRFPFWA